MPTDILWTLPTGHGYVSHGSQKVLDRLLGREDNIVFEDGKVDAHAYWDQHLPDWTSNPIMRLKWAILEDWIWEFLQGKARIDVVAMRELVELFPRLPVDLPEKLLGLSEERKQALTAKGTGLAVRYNGSIVAPEESRSRRFKDNKARRALLVGRYDQQVTPGMRRPYHYRRKKS